MTYNAAEYIAFNIKNVSSQNYPVAHYIFDGGSTDGTQNIVLRNCEEYSHLRLIEGPDDGIYDAMNKAITEVKGNYDIIALLNADDFYTTNDALCAVTEIFIEKGADLVCANVGYVEDSDKPLERLTRYSEAPNSAGFFYFGGQFAHPGIFVRSTVYDALQYDTYLDIAADFDFQLRAFNAGMKFNVTKRHLVNQRTGGYSQSGIKSFIRGKQQIFTSVRREGGVAWAVLAISFNIARKLYGKFI